MSRVFGRRRLALMSSAAFLVVCDPALAQTFTVVNGQIDTVGKTLNGTQTGTVDAGGTLRTSGGTVAINWNNTSTGVVITNSGTIEQVGTGRAIDSSGGGGTTTPRTLTFLNNVGAILRAAQNDAFRINTAVTGGTILIDNAGLIQAGGTGFAGLGQALDLRTIAAASGVTLTIVNRATGVIESLTDDAIRPGENATISNFGIIRSFGTNTASGASDGIDAGARTGVVVTNQTGGLISGARHGITADTNITVVNQAGATILGRNGSGVGSDGAGTVTNLGTITGAYAGVGNIFNSSGVASVNGDGDGIDTDLAATITNYGIIQGTGAGGFDSGGRSNNSEGIAIGGGTIDNFGTISGAGRGIIVNNDAVVSRSGVAATTITNNVGGLIIGHNGFAIRLENKLGTAADNDTIVNYGTIVGNGVIPDPNAVVLMENGTVDLNSVGTLDGVVYTGTGSARFIRGDGSAIQMGEGSDVLTNFGIITGNNGLAVNMEGGSDTVSINAGSRITGLVNGGTGTDTLNYNKVGLTEAKRAALQAGQTVNIGGTLYTSFEVVNGAARSFQSFATNGTTAGIAALFDNGSTTTGAGASMVALIDTVASASDVGAALAQLTPSAFQAFTNFGINNALMTTSLIGNRLAGARQGGLTFDMSGAATATAMFNAGMFAMKRTPGTDQIASLVADPIGTLDATAFADPAVQFDQHAAYAGFARGPSGNVHKAPAAAPAVVLDNGFFISSGYLVARQGARENAPATRFNTASVVTGVDRRLTDNIVAGVFAGFARTYGELDSLGSTTGISTGLGGAYGSYVAGPWFANAAAVLGRSSYESTRIALGTTNTSTTHGHQYAVQAAGGFDARFGDWQVTPEVGAQYTRVSVDGFTETGSPAALVVASDEASSLRSSLGARIRYDWAAAWGVVTPEWRIAWQHEFLNGARDLRASFIDAAFPGQFLTTTGAPGRDFVLVGTGVGGRLGAATTVSLDYDALIGTADFVAHRVTGRFRHMF
jgi:uncharacterized protein YhjY with autotransporter beta-barrel domain